jgi:hypothetical protein
MFPRSFAQRFDISQKWFISHSVTPCFLSFTQGRKDITSSVTGEQVSWDPGTVQFDFSSYWHRGFSPVNQLTVKGGNGSLCFIRPRISGAEAAVVTSVKPGSKVLDMGKLIANVLSG